MPIKSILITGFLFTQIAVFGQLGIQVQWQSFQDTGFIYNGTAQPPGEVFYINQYGAGIDYTFKLKNYRVEFFPTLLYFQKKYQLTTDVGSSTELLIRTLGLQFNTHFYFLDIEGDCNCPTWSKDGQFMKKGLFAWLSLNAYHTNYDLNGNNADKMFTYGLGGGIGLDVGLSKRLTLTPLAGLELERRPISDLTETNYPEKWMSKITASLRIAYHFGD